MELPQRTKDDRFTVPGFYGQLESRIRRGVAGREIPTLLISAFDHRTRVGPYVFIDRALVPGAARSIAAALLGAGIGPLRVVLQQWAPRVCPSQARIGGRPPELLLVSSMQIHSAPAYRLLDDARRQGRDRPLVIVGGAKAVYEPWDFFDPRNEGRATADVVVTGEEVVLLELLDRIVEFRGARDTMRAAFERARQAGALETIPGLVYLQDRSGRTAELVNTGIQRLVRDLDELPFGFEALGVFEPPHRRTTLARDPIPMARLGRHGPIMAIVTTHGCKFHCPYCPIPAYNQRTFRTHSAQRVAEEMAGISERTGIRSFFGTDDNFFNDPRSAGEVLSAMARQTIGGRRLRERIWFGTEATEFDVERNLDLLPVAREAGLKALWFGIEDMTAELINKGQDPEKTARVFRALLHHEIAPMPMLIHHDEQPLWSSKGLSGLLNQIRFLRKAGSVSIQITALMPMVGSKNYEAAFRDGLVLRTVKGRPVEDVHFDGNHVVASKSAHPWRNQINVLLAYTAFYNPLNVLKSLVTVDPLWKFRCLYQVLGNLGIVQSVLRGRDWFQGLASGSIERHEHVIAVPPMRWITSSGPPGPCAVQGL
jgi:radical SAM superfamily enzyme YgiQ (UPF0313 family)